MDFVNHSVIEFKRKNRLLRNVSYRKLLHICRQNGYIVKSFSKASTILISLGIYKKLANADSVTIIDGEGNTIILLRDNLKPRRRLFALAHELGHIYLQHTDCTDKKAEDEANLFAHLLLAKEPINWKRLLLSLICFGLAVYFCLNSANAPTTTSVNTESVADTPSSADNTKPEIDNSATCFYTEYGTVYHLYRDCHYLKNSKQIFTSTVATCGKDRLCSACKKRKNK